MIQLASQTSSDISYEMCVMNNKGKQPSFKKLHEAKKTLLKVKSQKLVLKFHNPRNHRVLAYADAINVNH